WARPLAEGALPLSIAGLAISSWDVFFHDIPAMALLGLAVSAATLAGLTRDRRWPALYVTAILAGYLTIQAAAPELWIAGLPGAAARLAAAGVPVAGGARCGDGDPRADPAVALAVGSGPVGGAGAARRGVRPHLRAPAARRSGAAAAARLLGRAIAAADARGGNGALD